MASSWRPIFTHSSTDATGITLVAPLYSAVQIVEVALSTSIITTILFFTSYKCKSAGERHTSNEGRLVAVIYSFNKRLLSVKDHPPLLRLCIVLNGFVTQLQQVAHVPPQVKAVHQSPQEAVRHSKLHDVYRNGAVIDDLEVMLMAQVAKIALFHFIAKVLGAAHLCDTGGELPRFTQVTGSPGNGLILRNEPVQAAFNGLFPYMRHTALVQGNAP